MLKTRQASSAVPSNRTRRFSAHYLCGIISYSVQTVQTTKPGCIAVDFSTDLPSLLSVSSCKRERGVTGELHMAAVLKRW